MYNLLKDNIKKYKVVILILFLIQLISVFIGLLSPYLNGVFIDLLVYTDDLSEIVEFVKIVLSVGLFTSLFNYVYKYLAVRVSNLISNNLVVDYYKVILNQKFERIIQYEKSYLNQRIKGDCESVISFWINNVLTSVINLMISISLLLYFYIYNRSLFYLIIVFVPIYTICYKCLKKSIYEKKYKSLEKSNRYYSNLNDLYIRLKEIKIKLNSVNELKKLEVAFKEFLNETLDYFRYSFGFTCCEEIIALIFRIALYLICGISVISKEMTIGEFTFINTYFNIIIEKVKYFFELGQSYQGVKVSINRLFELKSIEQDQQGELKPNVINRIELEEINYEFDGKKLYENNLNLCFQNNHIYLITGKNGFGKTTLIYILAGLYTEHRYGKLNIDEHPIETINMNFMRKNTFSMLLQDEVFPNIKVCEYLKLNDNGSISQIESSNEFKQLFHNDIFDINNLMNKSMVSLSSGERQLVQLYICIKKPASIYIFDEPTSNVHSLIKVKIWEIIEYMKMTQHCMIIIISHDKNICLSFDKHYNLEKNNSLA